MRRFLALLPPLLLAAQAGAQEVPATLTNKKTTTGK